ncbi:MAG TPA: alpha/beta hydrolase [Candidatus Mediterraneibacter excrementigallinarum]|nr:alpha/beta hydrolase [Candidatus Mediterraneibacter excrementigallinarum]
MDREKIRNMDFQEFKKVLPSMEGVHYLKADGTEVYGVYKHDVCYVERDGVKRTLQMIVPEMKPDKNYTYPAILYVQGSAWMKQDNYKRLGVMARLAQRGYVTAILQYRESSIASYPAPVEDAKTGVRFLRMHAEEYHIDPENIVIMGDSSGGHTALAAGITAEEDCMDTEIYSGVSCSVKAIVDLYGVTDICQKTDFPTTPNQGESDSPEGMLIGGNNVYEHPELSGPVIISNYVKAEKEIPPILMMHGTADDTVSCDQSIRLYKKFLEEGKNVTFYLVKNAGHGDIAFWTEKNIDLIDGFIRKYIS